MSPKNTLSKLDIKEWVKETLVFSTPAVFAFLDALQNHDFHFALGAGFSALLASLINLHGKYVAGAEQGGV